MKIGTIYTLYGRRAGAELFFERTIVGLARTLKAETYVFCNSQAYETLKNESLPFLIPVKINHLNSQVKKAFWLEFLSKNTIKTYGIDVFWIPSGTNHFPGNWRVPNVVTFLDLGEYHVKRKYDLKRTIYRKLICVPRSLRRATVLTSISGATDGDLQNLFSRSSKVIYPGISPRESRQGPSQEPIDVIFNETGVTLTDFIFTPGRTDYEGKGLDILLAAYKKFTSQAPNAPSLVLVGPEGEGHHRFIDKIKELGLSDRVFWLGRVSDECVDALYASCCFVVISSKFEGFGFPVLEAMQNHVPVICSDAGSLPEVVGDAALIFESGSIEQLYQRMFFLFNSEHERDRLRNLGTERVKIFSWERTFVEMAHIFESLVGK